MKENIDFLRTPQGRFIMEEYFRVKALPEEKKKEYFSKMEKLLSEYPQELKDWAKVFKNCVMAH